MLRKKAVEELKKEQERKAAERIHTIGVRCGSKKELVNIKIICLFLLLKQPRNWQKPFSRFLLAVY
jgi:hypothetical protein